MKGYDGGSKGIAFIRFADAEGLAQAEQNTGIEMMGRQIYIEKTKPKEDRPQRGDRNQGQRGDRFGGNDGGNREPRGDRNEDNTIFVGNVSFNTDKDELWNFFSACGGVKDVRIAVGQDGQVIFIFLFSSHFFI